MEPQLLAVNFAHNKDGARNRERVYSELEETTKIKTDCIIIIVTLINLPQRSWMAVANLSFFPIVDNPRLSIDASDKMRSDCSVRSSISSSSNFLAMPSSLNSAFAQTLTRWTSQSEKKKQEQKKLRTGQKKLISQKAKLFWRELTSRIFDIFSLIHGHHAWSKTRARSSF